MSVTFAAELAADAADMRVFTVACDTDGQVIGEFTGYANAYGQAQAHGLLCTGLCAEYGADVDEVHAAGDPVPVNVSSRNAVDLLVVLGYDVALRPAPDAVLGLAEVTAGLEGEADAEAFLGRVELALGLGVDDAALPAVQWRGENGGARHTDCGRAAGYLAGRLLQLRELALACRARGVRVVWN
jgi:hypothetical protein